MMGLADILADVLDAAHSVDVASDTITYIRPDTGQGFTCRALVSLLQTEQQIGFFVPVNYKTFDFVIERLYLSVLDPNPMPQAGDLITDSKGNEYTVNPLFDNPPSRFSDTSETLVRVHTKQTKIV